MSAYISRHEAGVRAGADACPGIDERGQGLTMSLIHDGTCCEQWQSGSTPPPRRAAEWSKVAARWGTTWPQPGEQAPDMAGDSNWAGRGFTRAGPQGQDLGPVSEADAVGQHAASEYESGCPLHMWGGPGHSAPFRGCPGDREREAG
jgi:hypothetical protein